MEHEEFPNWRVTVLEREIFDEVIPEQPYIVHQQIEPKMKFHIACFPDGRQEDNCICGDEIPKDVMRKYLLLKSTWLGPGAGQ